MPVVTLQIGATATAGKHFIQPRIENSGRAVALDCVFSLEAGSERVAPFPMADKLATTDSDVKKNIDVSGALHRAVTTVGPGYRGIVEYSDPIGSRYRTVLEVTSTERAVAIEARDHEDWRLIVGRRLTG